MIKMEQKQIILMIMWLVICATLVSGLFYDYSSVEALCKDDATAQSMGYDDKDDCVDSLDDDDIGNLNPREDDWYEVEAWEIEYCQREAPYNTAAPLASADPGFPYLSQVTYTVIGELTDMSNPLTNEPYYFYEVNYYLYPWDMAYEYAVRLSHSEKTETNPRYFHELVAATSIAQDESVSGYIPIYLPEDYDQVELALKGSGSWVTLTVTLVDSITGDQDAINSTGTSTSATSPW